MTNREDPRYKKFFDRLQYGVGLAQVQGAMMNEGIANYMEILENPDAPSGGVKEGIELWKYLPSPYLIRINSS